MLRIIIDIDRSRLDNVYNLYNVESRGRFSQILMTKSYR